MNAQWNIAAVVVTYHPSSAALARLLDALACQADAVIVVDNSGNPDVRAQLAQRGGTTEQCIAFSENRGVAAAHNAGIARARELGAQYVLLMDQDSEPAPDMVARLADAARRLEQAGHTIAAVGPRYIDPRQPAHAGFTDVELADSEPLPTGIAAVDHVISSGALIPMTAIDRVGAMNEALFIDYVDIEWALRAKAQGYRSYGVRDAVLHHALGDAPLQFMGKTFPAHTPLRHYYRFRNGVWLYRQPGLPLAWKKADAWRLAKRYVFVAFKARPRLQHLRMMTLGIWHGVHGRLGPLKRGNG